MAGLAMAPVARPAPVAVRNWRRFMGILLGTLVVIPCRLVWQQLSALTLPPSVYSAAARRRNKRRLSEVTRPEPPGSIFRMTMDRDLSPAGYAPPADQVASPLAREPV